MSKGSWCEFDNSSDSLSNEHPNLVKSKEKQLVRVQKTKAGKRGKLVTVISGLELVDSEAKKLIKVLKSLCGTGGTIKGDLLELQGDQIKKVMDYLKIEGYRPKQSGG